MYCAWCWYMRTLIQIIFFLNQDIVTLPWYVGFCCTMKWISYVCAYTRSLWELPPPSSPHPTPLGDHRAQSWVPSVSQQLPTSCFTQGRAHCSLPVQSPFLCLPLYSCPANRFICHFSRIHIYVLIFVFLFLTCFILYDRFWVHPLLCRWHNFVPFCGWIIFHCRSVCLCHIFFVHWLKKILKHVVLSHL